MNIHITWLTHVRTGPKKKIATGITPQQPSKRKPRPKGKKKASASKRLSFCEAVPSTFSTLDSARKREELRALVEFVVLHYDGDKWPHNKKDTFWNSAAEFVAERTSTSRTGKTNHICSGNCYYPCLLHFSCSLPDQGHQEALQVVSHSN